MSPVLRSLRVCALLRNTASTASYCCFIGNTIVSPLFIDYILINKTVNPAVLSDATNFKCNFKIRQAHQSVLLSLLCDWHLTLNTYLVIKVNIVLFSARLWGMAVIHTCTFVTQKSLNMVKYSRFSILGYYWTPSLGEWVIPTNLIKFM